MPRIGAADKQQCWEHWGWGQGGSTWGGQGHFAEEPTPGLSLEGWAGEQEADTGGAPRQRPGDIQRGDLENAVNAFERKAELLVLQDQGHTSALARKLWSVNTDAGPWPLAHLNHPPTPISYHKWPHELRVYRQLSPVSPQQLAASHPLAAPGGHALLHRVPWGRWTQGAGLTWLEAGSGRLGGYSRIPGTQGMVSKGVRRLWASRSSQPRRTPGARARTRAATAGDSSLFNHSFTPTPKS